MEMPVKEPRPNRQLRHEREIRGWSQRKVADEIGTNVDTVSKWERGINVPDPYFRERLCDLFHKTALELGFIGDRSGISKESQRLARSRSSGEGHPEDVSGAEGMNVSPIRREDWGEAPFVKMLYGRDKELEKMSQWVLADKCSVVALVGIGGIGKTSLAVRFVEQVKEQFEYIFWRSLQNAPFLKSVLRSCIHFFSQQQQINLPEPINEQILIFLDYLRNHRCLVILDNMESLLEEKRVGTYRQGYDEYGMLLQSIGQTKHQSCLLLTSREKMREVARLEGQETPVRSLQLSGLGASSSQALLQNAQMFGGDEAWKALIQLYAGNPLYLKLVSEPVREVFGGDIAKFLEKGSYVLGDIRDPLDLQFSRLSDLEKNILYWLAIEREAVSFDELQDNYVSRLAEEELPGALWSLRRRFLVEVDTAKRPRFFLQPVITEYITDQFTQEVIREIEQEKVNGICMSHALIKAQAKDYVRNIQDRLILAPVVKQLLRNFEEAEVVEKLQCMLNRYRDKYTGQAGYLAGNVLNILIYLNAPLQAFDFSGLTVRQAYLRGASLPDVNFTRADLTKSVFTDTFGSILTVTLSPSGSLLAAGTANGEIRLWRVHDGTPLNHYTGHLGWVWSVAFNSDESLLVSGSEDKTVRLWDVQSGKCLAVLDGHTNRVRSVTFSPDATLIASGSEDQTIRLWERATGQCFKLLEGYGQSVRPIAFSPDGTKLLNGGSASSAWLWDVISGCCIQRFEGHVNQIWSVAFSHDGKMIATAGDDEVIRLWDIETGKCIRKLQGHTGRIWSISLSSDGALLASGSDDKTIRLWHVESGECFKTLQGHTNRIWSVAASSDGAVIASGSDDQTVRLWNAKTGQSLNTLQGHANWIWSVAWSPSGEYIASCDEDMTIRLWDVNAKHCFQAMGGHTNRIRSIAFAPDGRTLASCSEDQTARLWSFKGGLCLWTFQASSSEATPLALPANRVWSVAYSPSARVIATGNEDQTVRLWDVETGECLHILKGHEGWVWSVAFSPDGTLLVSGGEDTAIRIWDTATGECKGHLRGHTSRIWSVAISADGNAVAGGGDDQVIFLWDLHTQQLTHTFAGHTNHVRSIAFSPDGSVLASASEDQTAMLWDLKTHQHLRTLEGHTNRVLSVSFSPNGNKIATGSHDGTIMIWDMKTAQCVETLRPDRPYERMNITGVRGLTEVQKNSLKFLGAIEK
ncbi:MAG TPA: NB-ARC domain-containing protein [Ktedonobacteraceae bacterium]|nr:NB-ARC domain-containing protein [Ktedonobacteraceae bacterium]